MKNSRANALNRKPEYLENKKHISHAILKIDESGLLYNQPQLAAALRVGNTQEVSWLRAAYKKDIIAKAIMKNILRDSQFSKDKNRVLLYQGLIYVPNPLRKDVISQNHNSLKTGY